MISGLRPAELRRLAADRYERLEEDRRTAPLVSVAKRFIEIDGPTQGALLAVELFTTVIPLMIIGFSYSAGFAENVSVANLFVRQLGLEHPLDDTVRSAFGTSSGLRSTWTIFGVAGFLVWGIPMSITVASMFAKAWRREQFAMAERVWRGALWFVLYLAMMVARERVAFVGHASFGLRALLFLASAVTVWIFWSVSPVLLVRNGGHGRRYLMLAGFAGVIVDGVVLPLAARVVFPMLLEGWTGFGPIGVAMTLMTWCGVLGIGWVVTACMGAVLWERIAPADTVVGSQRPDPPGVDPPGGDPNPSAASV